MKAVRSRPLLVYYVFDLLVLPGRDVMSEPLAQRRDLLRSHVPPKLREPVRESPELNASLADVISAVRAQGLEGIVAKNLNSSYEPGRRSGAWQKMRVNKGQQFVIAGYTLVPRRASMPSFLDTTRMESFCTREGLVMDLLRF